MKDLNTEIILFRALCEQIAELNDLDADDEFVIGSAEGCSSISEAIVHYARIVEELEADAKTLSEWIAKRNERKRRFENTADKIRAKLAWAMAESGLKNVKEPDMTISVRDNPAGIQFTCEPHEAPEQFVTTKTSYSWNRAAVKEALEKGDLPFAHKTNGGQSISIRTK